MSRKTNRDVFAKLDRIYARLPVVKCKGLCSVACGPIPLALVEADRLRRVAHREPRVVDVHRCSLLKNGRCTAYAARPLICRVWGVVKRMSCMHGCAPDRWLTDHEFVEIAREVERLGGGMAVTTPDGVAAFGDSFFDLDTSARSPEAVEREAEHVRGLRALFGGRILGVSPRGPGGFVKVDDEGDR